MNFKDCPVCGSGAYKVYVDPETGMWFCFAGSHHAGGKVDVGLPPDANTVGKDILRTLRGKEEPEGWNEISLPDFEPLSPAALRYLAKRGFRDREFLAEHGIVEWTGKHRILVPYFNEQGMMIYWNSRRYSDNLGDGPKYVACPGRHPLYTPRDMLAPCRVVLVEGVFDALAVDALDLGVLPVALCGKSLPRYLKKDLRKLLRGAILEVPDIALDPDALAAAVTLREQWGGRILTLTHDPAELFAMGELEAELGYVRR